MGQYLSQQKLSTFFILSPRFTQPWSHIFEDYLETEDIINFMNALTHPLYNNFKKRFADYDGWRLSEKSDLESCHGEAGYKLFTKSIYDEHYKRDFICFHLCRLTEIDSFTGVLCRKSYFNLKDLFHVIDDAVVIFDTSIYLGCRNNKCFEEKEFITYECTSRYGVYGDYSEQFLFQIVSKKIKKFIPIKDLYNYPKEIIFYTLSNYSCKIELNLSKFDGIDKLYLKKLGEGRSIDMKTKIIMRGKINTLNIELGNNNDSLETFDMSEFDSNIENIKIKSLKLTDKEKEILEGLDKKCQTIISYSFRSKYERSRYS